MAATDTSFSVLSTTGAASGDMMVVVDSEYILVTVASPTSFNVVGGLSGRGQEGTTATTHNIGAYVLGILTAGALNSFTQGGVSPTAPLQINPTYTATSQVDPVIGTAGSVTADGVNDILAALSTSFASSHLTANAGIYSIANLLNAPDDSFESGVGTFTGTNCTLATTTTQHLYGSYSLAMTASGSGNMYALGGSYAVSPNTEYSLIASFLAATTGRSAYVAINWLDSGSVYISQSSGAMVSDVTTGWTQATVTDTSPSNAAYAEMNVWVGAPAASEVHYVDGVSFMPGPARSWYAAQTNALDIVGLYIDGSTFSASGTFNQSYGIYINGPTLGALGGYAIYVASGLTSLQNLSVAGTGTFLNTVEFHQDSVFDSTMEVNGQITAYSGLAMYGGTAAAVTDGLYQPATHQIGLSTNGLQALLIDANQQLGLGIAPTARLSVAGSIDQVTDGLIESNNYPTVNWIKLYDSGNGRMWFNTAYGGANGGFHFQISGADRLVIDGNGHLVSAGSTPTLGALQTGVSSQTISGSDTAGLITLVLTGTPPTVGATVAIVNFAASYGSAPAVFLSNGGSEASGNIAVTYCPENVATGSFGIFLGSGGLPASGTVYIYYFVLQA